MSSFPISHRILMLLQDIAEESKGESFLMHLQVLFSERSLDSFTTDKELVDALLEYRNLLELSKQKHLRDPFGLDDDEEDYDDYNSLLENDDW